MPSPTAIVVAAGRPPTARRAPAAARCCAKTCLLLLALLLAAQLPTPARGAGAAAAATPVHYWRFEDAASPGKDSAPRGGVALRPRVAAPRGPAWRPRAFADGGIVGGYVAVQNGTLAASGGPFPSSATAPGVTVEFLFRAGRDFQRFGNTTLFGVTPAASPGGGWIEAGLLRHSMVWRADASLVPDGGECASEQDAVLPSPVPCSRLEVPLDQAGPSGLPAAFS